MAVMTASTCRHAEFKLATNTALSDFPNVEAKREEQRNCLKHVVGRIDVFAILVTKLKLQLENRLLTVNGKQS